MSTAPADSPPFRAHPWVRGGHAQTLVGRYWPERRPPIWSKEYVLDLVGGDRLSVLESRPPGPIGLQALLVHGLCGCARSPYVERLALMLLDRGIGVVRMNLRGAGSGFGLARGIYHSGRTEDVRAVVDWMAAFDPAPIALVGFSLGGNLVLKLAAEASDAPLPRLDSVAAASPPIDLAACADQIARPENRLYNRNFVRLLTRDIARLHARFPDLGPIGLGRLRTLRDFDQAYTAPRNGFRGAADYYERSSAAPLVGRISVPGLVIHAEDDPFIPAGPIRSAKFSSQIALELASTGGHLGFVARRGSAGGRRWLESRLARWLDARRIANEPPVARV